MYDILNNGIDDIDNESNCSIRLKFSWEGSFSVPWHTIDHVDGSIKSPSTIYNWISHATGPKHCSVWFLFLCFVVKGEKRDFSSIIGSFETQNRTQIHVKGYQMTHDQQWAHHICRSQKIILIMMVVDFSSYYNLHIIAFIIQPKHLNIEGIWIFIIMAARLA